MGTRSGMVTLVVALQFLASCASPQRPCSEVGREKCR
jgi:hypothetical protein